MLDAPAANRIEYVGGPRDGEMRTVGNGWLPHVERVQIPEKAFVVCDCGTHVNTRVQSIGYYRLQVL